MASPTDPSGPRAADAAGGAAGDTAGGPAGDTAGAAAGSAIRARVDDGDPDSSGPSRAGVTGGDVSAAALARFRRRLRRPRLLYAIAVGAVALAMVVVTAVSYAHGEISHATLHTVAQAPPPVPLASTTPTQLSPTWTTSDSTALGDPAYDGTVVTFDRHTVRGRDALTGRPTWSYTRTDRTMCTAIQVGGVTVAVYRLGGNCDELTAVATDTGARRWTRTLDKDGAEFDGPAGYSVNGTDVLFVSATSVYAIDTGGSADTGNGGLDYWTFHHPGCTIHGAVWGQAGALISQTCAGQDCGTLTYCRDGDQLLLRQATSGTDSTDTKNPEHIQWLRSGRFQPVVAGSTIAALPGDAATTTLQLLAPATGATRSTVTLQTPAAAPLTSGTVEPLAEPVTGGDLVQLAGVAYDLPDGADRPAWHAATESLPTAVDRPAGADGKGDQGSELTAVTPTGVVTLDRATGKVTRTYALQRPRTGERALPFGDGLLLTGAVTGYDR